jgi:FkbM family methyltransferase
VPYHAGKWRIIERLLRLSGVEELDRRRTFVARRQGLRWKLEPGCAVQRRLLYVGAFDVHDSRELLRPIGPGSVFFDVGSYFGYYSLLAARAGARVFAFEPVVANYELLLENLALNPCGASVFAQRCAVSDVAGTVSFDVPSAGNRGTGRISSGGTGASLVTETVAAVTLDAFVADHGIERLDAIKVDVEGAERKVLAGGRQTLAHFRPVMLIEINPPCLARFGSGETEVLTLVREIGYTLWRANSTGLVPFEGIGADEAYANVLCLPKR